MVLVVVLASLGRFDISHEAEHSFNQYIRFKSRDVCDDVIKAFNNKTIQANNEEHTIQIRFADTSEQKSLKQTTAAARQFRSAEYEYAVQARKNGWFGSGTEQYSPGGQENAGNNTDEFESYLGTNAK